MNPSYVRIRLPLSAAMQRFTRWIGLSELSPATEMKASEAAEAACDGSGLWLGVAVFAHESSGWSVFDDLTGFLGSVTATRWAELAGRDDLVFAGYNDSVPYGQVIAVSGGTVVREFLEDHQDTRQNVNRGRLASEEDSPIDAWTTAASFVDADDLAHADDGLLWLFRQAA